MQALKTFSIGWVCELALGCNIFIRMEFICVFKWKSSALFTNIIITPNCERTDVGVVSPKSRKQNENSKTMQNKASRIIMYSLCSTYYTNFEN